MIEADPGVRSVGAAKIVGEEFAESSPGQGTPMRERAAHAHTLLLGLVAALLVLATLLYGRGAWALERRCGSMQSQLDSMKLDAARILDLRQIPQAALGRLKSSEELLATVELALSAAGIAREQWKDSIPQPLSRVAGTNYQKQATQLYLDDLSLQKLAMFVIALHDKDPTLSVSSLGLTQRPTAEYDVDLSIEYLVFSPAQK